jgi:hypothetical protein
MIHPITPPPELRQLWAQQAQRIDPLDPVQWMQYVSEKAAQWGADQELEACCTELDEINCQKYWSERLRAARRPKPPSLKEQALNEFDSLLGDSEAAGAAVILRALEALPE